jgi:uncharacterized protein (TIGR02246 family)
MNRRNWLGLVVVAPIMTVVLAAQSAESQIREFFKSYDAAFNAKDLDKLGTLYHPEVTIFEGAGIDRGWAAYRDKHLGPELKMFQNLQWAHSNIVVHSLGDAAAYVTAEYTLKYQNGDRTVDTGGIATHVLVREQGQWKIRHSHTATRRRPAGGLPVVERQ